MSVSPVYVSPPSHQILLNNVYSNSTEMFSLALRTSAEIPFGKSSVPALQEFDSFPDEFL